jgi:hypothetical protein
LSIIALGCHVSHIPEMEQCTAALHELIRRGIYLEVRTVFYPIHSFAAKRFTILERKESLWSSFSRDIASYVV